MHGEREWIARCCSLAQTERDLLRQLSNAFDRAAEFLSREDREALAPSQRSVFQPSDRSFVQQFHQASHQIATIRPTERGFKSRLDRLEKDITTLRVASAADLERHNLRIHRIADDIDRREKRLAALETPALRPHPKPPVEFESPISEFEHFLSRNGGRTGGWDPQSHAEFLRALERYGENGIAGNLPNVPEEAVEAHVEWHRQFAALKQRMKVAVNEMRQKRVQADEAPEDPGAPKVDSAAVVERLQERQRAKQQHLVDAREREEANRKADEDRRRQKFEQLRQDLMCRKVSKPAPIEETAPENVAARKPAIRPEDWERIKKRDEAVVERKNAVKVAQEAQMQARESRQKRLAEQNAKQFRHAKRDPERLMQPTAAVLARQKADDDEPKGPVNSVFMIPHRAIPAWML
jgi:hypothetical protein